MTTTFETAKIGDKVWSIQHGWGEIRSTDIEDSYPIYVYFPGGGHEKYTVDGLYFLDDIVQSLFWDEVKIEAPLKPMPDLEVDTKVLVWTDPENKYKRHFSHFEGNRIYVFNGGNTSFSAVHPNYVTGWPYWEIVE